VSPSDYEEIPVGPLAGRDRHAAVVGGKTAHGESVLFLACFVGTSDRTDSLCRR